MAVDWIALPPMRLVLPNTFSNPPTMMSNRLAPAAKKRASRILIVEDEALIALDLEQHLKILGYEVVGTADCCEQVLEMVTQTPPDLILMDICISGKKDGIETAQIVSQMSDIPIIFLTAYTDDLTIQRATSVSPYGYILKPFDTRSLMATLTMALERHATDNYLRVLNSAMEAASVGVILVDATGDERSIVFANKAISQMVGLPVQEIISKSPYFFVSDIESPSLALLQEALVLRSSAEGIVSGKRADNSVFWALITVSPVLNRYEKATHMVIFHKDITREHIAQTNLASSQRLELVGRLSSGIAHDINNILSSIIAHTALANESKSDIERNTHLEAISASVQSGALLTRKLSNFTKNTDEDSIESIELTQVIDETLPLLERMATSHIILTVSLAPDPMPVSIHTTFFQQILLSLVAQACDVWPEGGRVILSASCPKIASEKFAAHEYAQIELHASTGEIKALANRQEIDIWIKLALNDEKALQLATCKMLVEQAGGTMYVRTINNAVVDLVIELPLSKSVRYRSTLIEPISSIQGNAAGAVCLLVEDDVSLRRIYAQAMEMAGFETIAVGSAERAIQEIDHLGNRLRILVCDLILPQQNGTVVLEYARKVVPEAVNLVISGYTDAEHLPSDVEVLWKPFSKDSLVRRALDMLQIPVGATQSASSTPPQPEQRRAPLPPQTTPLLNVLVVEDDDMCWLAIRVFLKDRGLLLFRASTVAEASTLAGNQSFQLALVDVNLPDANGLDLLLTLRKQDPLLPCLIMTGDQNFQTAQRAFRARAAGYITKPIDRNLLVEEVERAIHEGQLARLQRQLLISKVGLSTNFVDLTSTGRDFDEALHGLYMVYQPIVRPHDQSIFAFEALLRSTSQVLKGPAQLLAAADALGRMEELGRKVRESIAKTLYENPSIYHTIFVNIHPSELHSDLTAKDEPLLPFASRIVLEVTERAQIESDDTLNRILPMLRAAGYRIALDDLGEGYAGLSWLIKLTPNIAKLDMSLIRDIDSSRLKRELVASLVSVCRRTQTIVVAEGVETQSEARILTDLRCDLLQGYYFSRPGPPFPLVNSH